jgi:hypothetical protein
MELEKLVSVGNGARQNIVWQVGQTIRHHHNQTKDDDFDSLATIIKFMQQTA